MLTRDDFATAVLIQLADAGETRALYDAASFSVVRQHGLTETGQASIACQLEPWYQRFLQADREGTGDVVIAQIVQQWGSAGSLAGAATASPPEAAEREFAAQNIAIPALPVGTTMSQPLPPPPEAKPPPEPSWWPVLGCGLICVLSLGCCMGGVLFGLNWMQETISASVDRAKALNERQKPRPPQVAKNREDPLAPPVLALPPRDAIPQNIQREMEQAIREAERQMAAAMPPPVRPFEPQEFQEPPLEPFPELGQPGQELPALAFAPPDLVAVGPEVRGDELFQDIAPAGGWLVGYRAMKGESWGGSIVALQPIYQVGGEYHLGQACGGRVAAIEQRQFLAKPGYAVGKIEARIGLIMNAVRVEFRKVDGRKLDQADAYFSEWFGGSGGGLQEMDGGGSPLVGLAGSYHPRDELISIQALKLMPR